MDRAKLNPDDAEAPVDARFTTAEFYRIADSGALDRFAKSELHDGRIVAVNAQYVPHSRLKTQIAMIFMRQLEGSLATLEVLVESAVEIASDEVLEPDVVVYEAAGPAIERGLPIGRVRLIVEVAGSSAELDLGRKRLRYAAAGVPEYWVALLPQRRFERFSQPQHGDYRGRDAFPFVAGCASLTLPGLMVPEGTIRD